MSSKELSLVADVGGTNYLVDPNCPDTSEVRIGAGQKVQFHSDDWNGGSICLEQSLSCNTPRKWTDPDTFNVNCISSDHNRDSSSYMRFEVKGSPVNPCVIIGIA